MAAVSITIEGCTVLLVASPGTKLDIPRRQGFAWSKDAERYAERLSAERGWPINRMGSAAP